jgi:acetyl esterase/lipase
MDTKMLPLWPAGKVPGAIGTEDQDIPAITLYPAPADKDCGASVVVCPGGGYGHLAPHEGEPIALWLNTLGVTAAVLRYRLGPRYKHPAMGDDVFRALRTVRANAAEWKLDPLRIGVLGFSAGGHLASTASTHYDAGNPTSPDPIERQSSRPDLSILIYPVISMKPPYGHMGSQKNLFGPTPDPALLDRYSNETQITHDVPPTFLVHSTDDTVVPIENALNYALALHKNKVPFGMEVYDRGAHGYGLGRANDPVTSAWPDACARWMRARGYLDKTPAK